MSKQLSDFIFQSKYARYNSNLGRKETWEESVERISNMHMRHLGDNYPNVLSIAEFTSDYLEAIQSYKDKKVLGSQRGLQFGGDPILKKNCKIFNCSFTYADRLDVFKEIEWILLCGCGAGVSVEEKYVSKLPRMVEYLNGETYDYIIEDSIEGWAYAIDSLIRHYFDSSIKYPKFDYSAIRPNGSLISGGFVAPGPEGLKQSIHKIEEILQRVYKSTKRLSSLDVTDILSHEADSVLSGGVRRSAMIILFDPDNEEMYNCKTGNWFYDNPQRARFNMSAVLERNKTSKAIFEKLFSAVMEYGEPGFYWRSDEGLGTNPCGEIGFKPVLNGKTGVEFCNLITINGAVINTPEDFYAACKNAATIGTIQASYNKFPFLGSITEELIKNDPLIGVSIGGIMCSPDILTDSNILRKGAQIILEQNKKIANLLGINVSSRCTCIKPDGNSSVLLGMTPGCHGEHSSHYIRRVQANKEEEAAQIYKEFNPKSVVDSVWSNNSTDYCIMFPITAKSTAKFKYELLGTNQLNVVKNLYANWIVPGMRDPSSPIQNNVSNTVQVPEHSWDSIREWVWNNQNYIAGVSFIPAKGDLDYNQPPYTEVLMPNELLEEFGEGVIFASGLIVDCIDVFGDLWKACDCYNGLGEKLFTSYNEAKQFIKDYAIVKEEDFVDKPLKEYIAARNKQYNRLIELYSNIGYSEEVAEQLLENEIDIPIHEIQRYLDQQMFGKIQNLAGKRDLIRRIEKFACKYFDCDSERAIRALKQVQLYHDWCEITKSETPIDWSAVKWKNVLIEAESTAAQACSGGSCEISRL